MGRPRVQAYCRDCGRPCDRRGRWDHGYRCIECRVDRHEMAARQINARSGEYYEKWVAGMVRAIQREQAKIEDSRASMDSDHK